MLHLAPSSTARVRSILHLRLSNRSKTTMDYLNNQLLFYQHYNRKLIIHLLSLILIRNLTKSLKGLNQNIRSLVQYLLIRNLTELLVN